MIPRPPQIQRKFRQGIHAIDFGGQKVESRVIRHLDFLI
jgi:hypothetical protein